MRFIHTGDWHLGRLFHARSLVEDQAYLLDQFVELVRSRRPDAVLLAGDIYDRAVPPAEAVTLLDETLSRIVVGEGVPVVMIAGNHDSPDRLGFGARLLASGGLTVAGRYRGDVAPLELADEHGPLRLYPMPYCEPAVVRDALSIEVSDHDAAMAAVLDKVRAAHPAGVRSVLVAHAFVAGGAESESERPLSVGGSGAVDVRRFEGFDFVALGHLHRPQTLAGRLHYAGSLMKYSLSEADHDKSVSVVEIDGSGQLDIERVRLAPRRNLRRIRGELATLVEGGRSDPARDDYVFATLSDTGALLDPMARLREVYPNALGCEREVLQSAGEGRAMAMHRELDVRHLFADFFREVTGEALSDEQASTLETMLEKLERRDRESGA
jgi:exonuclease SbcD